MKRLTPDEEIELLRGFYRYHDRVLDYVSGSGAYTAPFTPTEIKLFAKLKKKYRHMREFSGRL